MNTNIIVGGVLVISAIIIAAVVVRGGPLVPVGAGDTAVAEIRDGKQYIDVTARGGYSPRLIAAQANMPTTLRMTTKSSFDCSTAFVIPALNIQKNLPMTGTTEFEIPPQEPGTEIAGLCSMGMYSFTMRFE